MPDINVKELKAIRTLITTNNFTVSFTGKFFVTISASQRTTFFKIFPLMPLISLKRFLSKSE